LLVVLGASCGAPPALAADTRVLLLRPSSPSPTLSEALVYVQGELGSVQLEPIQAVFQMRQQSAAPVFQSGTYGALVFMEQGGILIIEAYRPDVPEPIIQRLDTRDGRITPQVVAIRAVEALRAAMQNLVKSPPSDRGPVPEAVQRFARVKKPPTPSTPPERGPEPPEARELRGAPIEVGIWTAPELRLDPQADHPYFGFGTSIVVGKSWLFGVARFDTTLTPLEFSEDTQRTEVARMAATACLRLRGAWTENFGTYLDLGGGAALSDVQGFAGPSFETHRERHTSVVGVTHVGIDYWALRYLAFFVELFASTALDSPAVGLAGAERRRLERPLLGTSVGWALSYR
jgi:hypothetical protein